MKKGTLIVVGVFVVLLVAVLATRESHVSVGVKKLELPKLDKAKVSSLSLSGAKSAVLTKEGDVWKVADPAKPAEKHLADTAQVEAAIDAINELKSPEFLTDRAEKQAGFEVDDAKGLKLKVEQSGGKPVELVLGKASQNGGYYLRQPGSNEVFIYKGRLDYSVRKDVKAWRKKQIVAAKPEEVKKLVLRGKDGSEVRLVSEEGAWKLDGTPTPANFRFDVQAPQQMAAQLASLTAQDFLEGAEAADDKTGLAGPHDSVEAELKDGKKIVLHLGPQPEPTNAAALVAAKLDGDPQVYQLPQWTASTLRKHLPELRDLSLFTFDPTKAKAVRIQVGPKKVVVAKAGESWKIQEPKQLPTGFEFDPNEVMSQLQMLRSTRAVKALEGNVSDAQAGLSAPTATVTVELDGAPAQTLKFGKSLPSDGGKPASELYARTSVDPLTYAVSEGIRTRLSSGVELFKKQPPPPAFGNNMRGLESLPPEVRKQLEAQLRARAGQ